MPEDNADMKDVILKDVAYYRGAVVKAGPGVAPPTIYATRYLEHVEWLLDKLYPPAPTPAAEPAKSELEVALAHDAAGRTERRDTL